MLICDSYSLTLLASIAFLVAICATDADVTVIDETNVTVDELLSYTAEFGPAISDEGLLGLIVLSEPDEACGAPINKWPKDAPPAILLIARSAPEANCSFDLKVKTAQDAGYSAAIVYNYYAPDQIDSLLTMQHSDFVEAQTIRIPSVFISCRSGRKIINRIKSKPLHYKALLKRDSDDLIYREIKFYLIPFICILMLTLLFLCSLVAWRYIVGWRKERARRLPRSVLRTIPIKRFCKADNDTYDDTCAICLDDYYDGVKIRILSCGHAYHCKCIDPWLIKSRRTCPICKRRVLRSPRESSTSSVVVPASANFAINRRANNDVPNLDDSDTAPLLGRRNTDEDNWYPIDERHRSRGEEEDSIEPLNATRLSSLANNNLNDSTTNTRTRSDDDQSNPTNLIIENDDDDVEVLDLNDQQSDDEGDDDVPMIES